MGNHFWGFFPLASGGRPFLGLLPLATGGTPLHRADAGGTPLPSHLSGRRGQNGAGHPLVGQKGGFGGSGRFVGFVPGGARRLAENVP